MTRKTTGANSKTSFDRIMADPDCAALGSWWDANSFFALTRQEVEETLSGTEDPVAAILGSAARRHAVGHAEAA